MVALPGVGQGNSVAMVMRLPGICRSTGWRNPRVNIGCRETLASRARGRTGADLDRAR